LHCASLTPSLVLGTLQPLIKTEPTRSCYRLVGGVLVQRTVQDVVPALETNYSGIKEVLETLVKNYKAKEEEFGAFQREYKIGVSGYWICLVGTYD
jgi:prefoldin subunit 2